MYMDITLRESVVSPITSVPVAVPTIDDVARVANDLGVFSSETRRRVLDALPKVMTAEQYWSCGAPFRRGVPHFDGTEHPYRYCQKITQTQPIDDENVLRNVRNAAYLILVWYVHTIADNDAHRTDLLNTFFIVVHTTSTKRIKRTDPPPPPEQQRARTCACSEELVAYVRTMHPPPRNGNEFPRIQTFLVHTVEGKALLAAAGLDAFELDHYLPECMGGPSVLENAHIMPRNGVNQKFRDAWDREKRRYCGEAQHNAIVKLLPNLRPTSV